MSGTTVSNDSDRVFVLVPNRKTLVTVSGVSTGLSDKLKAHAQKSGVKTLAADHRDKEQTLCFRTAEEADATALASWLKANPLEVNELGNTGS